MGIHRNPKLEDIKNVRKTLKGQTQNKDIPKIHHMFFERMFSIEEIEHFFKGKYTYNEVRSIIRGKYIEYYEKESKNGR